MRGRNDKKGCFLTFYKTVNECICMPNVLKKLPISCSKSFVIKIGKIIDGKIIWKKNQVFLNHFVLNDFASCLYMKCWIAIIVRRSYRTIHYRYTCLSEVWRMDSTGGIIIPELWTLNPWTLALPEASRQLSTFIQSWSEFPICLAIIHFRKSLHRPIIIEDRGKELFYMIR